MTDHDVAAIMDLVPPEDIEATLATMLAIYADARRHAQDLGAIERVRRRAIDIVQTRRLVAEPAGSYAEMVA